MWRTKVEGAIEYVGSVPKWSMFIFRYIYISYDTIYIYTYIYICIYIYYHQLWGPSAVKQLPWYVYIRGNQIRTPVDATWQPTDKVIGCDKLWPTAHENQIAIQVVASSVQRAASVATCSRAGSYKISKFSAPGDWPWWGRTPWTIWSREWFVLDFQRFPSWKIHVLIHSIDILNLLAHAGREYQ